MKDQVSCKPWEEKLDVIALCGEKKWLIFLLQWKSTQRKRSNVRGCLVHYHNTKYDIARGGWSEFPTHSSSQMNYMTRVPPYPEIMMWIIENCGETDLLHGSQLLEWWRWWQRLLLLKKAPSLAPILIKMELIIKIIMYVMIMMTKIVFKMIILIMMITIWQ